MTMQEIDFTRAKLNAIIEKKREIQQKCRDEPCQSHELELMLQEKLQEDQEDLIIPLLREWWAQDCNGHYHRFDK